MVPSTGRRPADDDVPEGSERIPPVRQHGGLRLYG